MQSQEITAEAVIGNHLNTFEIFFGPLVRFHP